MKWIKFTERWPSGVSLQPYDEATEVIVRSKTLKSERRAEFSPLFGDWRLSDCTHPMQNCYFSTTDAEWLED